MQYPGLGYIGEVATLPMSLSINSQIQFVGKQPTYQISNARPNAQVQWSSYKNGVDTKEFLAGYGGQTIGSNGSLEVTGGAWTNNDVGDWLKEALVQNEDGTWSRAVVAFRVLDPATVESPVARLWRFACLTLQPLKVRFFQDTLFTVAGYNVTGTTVILTLGGIWIAKSLKLIK